MNAILLDLDGTLVDSRRDLSRAANQARYALHLPALPVETIVSYVGDGLAKLLQRCCPDADERGLAVAHDAFVTYYSEHCCDETRCYPGVEDSLQRLHAAGHPLAVVTNKPSRFSATIINGLGLDGLIQVLIGGDAEKKPSPEPLLRACEALGLAAADAVMCGDHHTDLLAAQAAGCRSIWCAWGIGHAGNAPCDLICEDAAQLFEVAHGCS